MPILSVSVFFPQESGRGSEEALSWLMPVSVPGRYPDTYRHAQEQSQLVLFV